MKAQTQSDSTESCTDLASLRILKLIHQWSTGTEAEFALSSVKKEEYMIT